MDLEADLGLTSDITTEGSKYQLKNYSAFDKDKEKGYWGI